MRTVISRKRDSILERKEGFFERIVELEGYFERDKTVRFAESGSKEYRLERDSKNVNGKMGRDKRIQQNVKILRYDLCY
jgi:hypothetical protein